MATTFNICRICSDEGSRREGMQLREMGPGECCLFVYDAAVSPRFWGRNTPQDLWVSLVSGGEVVDSQPIARMDETPVALSGRGELALETLVPLEIGSCVTVSGDEVAIS